MTARNLWTAQEDELAKAVLDIKDVKEAIEYVQKTFTTRTLMAVFQRVYIKFEVNHEAYKLLQKRMYNEKHLIDGELWQPTGAVCKMLSNKDERTVEDFVAAGVRHREDPELPGIVRLWHVGDFMSKVVSTPAKVTLPTPKETKGKIGVEAVKSLLVKVKAGEAKIEEVYALLNIA